jgi:hypothetical protein
MPALTRHAYLDWLVEGYENQPKEQPMDKPKLDFTKPETLQRRDGGEFRILATDIPGLEPIAVAYKSHLEESWFLDTLCESGKYYGSCGNEESPYDLIPKPVRVTGWCAVRCRDDGIVVMGRLHHTEAQAIHELSSSHKPIGVVKIDAEVQQ